MTVSTPAPAEIAVSLADKDDSHRIEGSFEARVPSRTAWEVLTDYERIGEFVSDLRESRVLKRDGNELLLEQEALASLLFFGRHVRLRLRVRESKPERIEFEDVLRQDFSQYVGSWRITEIPDGVHVEYTLSVKPRFRLPAFLKRRALRKAARGLLEEVREEILRRESPHAPAHSRAEGK